MAWYIKIFLLFTGIGNLISSIIWPFAVPTDKWLWFSRLCLAALCLGLYLIIEKLEELKKKND